MSPPMFRGDLLATGRQQGGVAIVPGRNCGTRGEALLGAGAATSPPMFQGNLSTFAIGPRRADDALRPTEDCPVHGAASWDRWTCGEALGVVGAAALAPRSRVDLSTHGRRRGGVAIVPRRTCDAPRPP